jgi:quercetin dioxygenase-like cupin family protein
LTEATLPPGPGAPSHIHEAHEEAFYVLEGELTFTVGSETVVAGPGDFTLVPRATSHGFDVTGSRPAKYLCIFSPPITDDEKASLARQVRESRSQS